MKSEQKIISRELSKEDIDSLKSVFENSEIISDEDRKTLNQKREKARKNNIVLGELFLYVYDTLSDYSYLFESEDNKDLRKGVEGYLLTFFDIVPKLRELIVDYEEGEIGSWWDGERIKDYIVEFRDRMSKLINVFFNIISERGGLGMIPGVT